MRGTSTPSTVTAERAQHVDPDDRPPTPGPPRPDGPGTTSPNRRRSCAASRAVDRSAPSASGSRPISTSSRAASGRAPPPDQIDQGLAQGVSGSAEDRDTAASSSSASASRSASTFRTRADDGTRAWSAAADRSPRVRASRPAVIRARGRRSSAASRSASADVVLAAVGCRVVGRQQSTAAESRDQHLDVAGAARQLDRLRVGRAGLLVMTQHADGCRRCRPGRGRPAPDPAVGTRRPSTRRCQSASPKLARPGERLAEVVQRRRLQSWRAGQAGHPGRLPPRPRPPGRSGRAASRTDVRAWSARVAVTTSSAAAACSRARSWCRSDTGPRPVLATARWATPSDCGVASRSASSRHATAVARAVLGLDRASPGRAPDRPASRRRLRRHRRLGPGAADPPSRSIERSSAASNSPRQVVQAGDSGGQTGRPAGCLGPATSGRRPDAPDRGRPPSAARRRRCAAAGRDWSARAGPTTLVDEVDVTAGIPAAEHGVAPFADRAEWPRPDRRRPRGPGRPAASPDARRTPRARTAARSGSAGPVRWPGGREATAGTMTTSVCVLTRRRGTSTPALQQTRGRGRGTGSRPVSTSSASHTSWLSGLARSTAATAARISADPVRQARRRRWRAIQSATDARAPSIVVARSARSSRRRTSPQKCTRAGQPAVSSATRSPASGSVTPYSSASTARRRTASGPGRRRPVRTPGRGRDGADAGARGVREAMATADLRPLVQQARPGGSADRLRPDGSRPARSRRRRRGRDPRPGRRSTSRRRRPAAATRAGTTCRSPLPR